MHLVLVALLAELLELQAILERFFILVGVVVDHFAHRTLQLDHVVLGHSVACEWPQCIRAPGGCQPVVPGYVILPP